MSLRFKPRSCLLFVVCVSLLPNFVLGQSQSIPSAHKVLKNYVEALGGKTKLKRIKVLQIRATSDHMFGPPSSIKVTWKNGKFFIEEEMKRSNNLTDINLDGFDGKVLWTKQSHDAPKTSDRNPARSLNNLERLGVTPYALNLLKFPGKVTQNGRTKINGRLNWHLTFEWPSGQKDERFFDIETGLLTRLKQGAHPSSKGGFGGGPPTRDFKWQDRQGNGLTKLQKSIVINSDNPNLPTHIKSTTFGGELDDNLFAIPIVGKQTN